MVSFRQQLQHSTASLHKALEQTALLKIMAAGTPTRQQYRQYLSAQLALIAPLEAQLRLWESADWSALRLVKSEWLLADLKALGCDEPLLAADVPSISSPAQALGVQYVLEGSTLGLMLLKKRLNPEDHDLAQASRFISVYGQKTPNNWQVFVERLDKIAVESRPEAENAACAVFSAYLKQFSTVDVL